MSVLTFDSPGSKFRSRCYTVIIILEEYIMVINNVSKFHKILIKTNGLIDRTLSKMVDLHEQRTMTPEGIMPYGPLLNLKKALWYETM